MVAEKREAGFFLSVEEKHAISLLLEPWKQIYVQSGTISERELTNPSIYSVGSLVVETRAKIMLLLHSKEFDGVEFARLAIVSNEDELEKMFFFMRPPLAELKAFPDDLGIDRFFGVRNEIFLLRFEKAFERYHQEAKMTTESGILISNRKCRMLLYPNEAVPLDFCVTTNEKNIGSILSSSVAAVRVQSKQ